MKRAKIFRSINITKLFFTGSLVIILTLLGLFLAANSFDFESMEGRGKYAAQKKNKYFSSIEGEVLNRPYLIVQKMNQIHNVASSYFEIYIWPESGVRFTIFPFDEHFDGGDCLSVAVNNQRIKCSNPNYNGKDFYACTSFFLSNNGILEGDTFSLADLVDQSHAIGMFFQEFSVSATSARSYNIPSNSVPIKKVFPTRLREQFSEPVNCWLEELVGDRLEQVPKVFNCDQKKYASCQGSQEVEITYNK